jgi:phospholipid transport system substrate-binding protein
MYMVRIILLALIALNLLFFVSPLLANSSDKKDDIKSFLQERDREIKALVGPKGTTHSDEQREKLKDIINDVMDYASMAEYALQSTFDELSSEQRREFIDIFSTIVRDQSLNSLDIYRADVEYREIRVNESTATVETIAILENVRTPVTYELKTKGDSWVITDMSIDNVSTAESYRRSFQNIIRRRGYDALLTSLKRRADA